MVRGDGGGRDDDLGAVGLEHVALVLADLVRAHEDAVVALALGDQGQADAGVAGRRLDDGAAGLERAGGLGGLDHPQRDAVLHRPAGVQVLDLGQHRGGDALGDVVELDERRVADEVGDVFGVLHRPSSQTPDSASAGARSRARRTGPRARRYRGDDARMPGRRTGVREGRSMGRARRRDTDRGDGGVRRRAAPPASACSALLGYGLLKAEAKMARRIVGRPFDGAPDDDGAVRRGPRRRRSSCCVLGDSSAAGLGADDAAGRPSARSSPTGVSALSGRPVRLTNVAVIGAESRRPGRPAGQRPGRGARRRTSRSS